MCPSNTTNLEDGSSSCPTSVLPGTNMTARYAVIVSFGVYLNGTSLDDIAQKVGRISIHPFLVNFSWTFNTASPAYRSCIHCGISPSPVATRIMCTRSAACTSARACHLQLQLTPSAHVQVGVNASSQDVLQHLIKADTASAFNISVGDVNVTGISQVRAQCKMPF